MKSPIAVSVTHVLRVVGIILMVPAVASTVWTYFAYALMIEPMGWGLTGRFLALIGAIAAGSLYWAGGYALITLVPRFGWLGRLCALPGIAAYMALVIASSSYPQVTLFQGAAVEAEVERHVARTATYADARKARLAKAKGLGPALEDIAARLDRLAALERNGTFSGIRSTGLVSSTLTALAADVRQSAGHVAAGTAAAEGVIQKMDATLQEMRAAAEDRTLDFDARRRAFEARADEMRTIAVALAQAIPLEPLSALAARMQQPLTKPATTGKADQRARQAEALAKLETELASIGADLSRRIEAAGAGLDSLPPVYRPAAPGIVVVKHWDVMVQAWAVSLAIDLFVIVLLFMACVAEDEASRKSRVGFERPAWAIELEQSINEARDLGELLSPRGDADEAGPFPNSTAARKPRRRPRMVNGADLEKEGV